VSTKEEDYSAWFSYESLCVHVETLLCGFTFTAITILLTLLPNPSSFLSQVTLCFLAFMFYLFEFFLFYAIYYLSYCVKAVPSEWKEKKTQRRILAWMWLLSLTVFGVAIVLMFLLWGLTYLALASGVMYALFTVLSAFLIWKPTLELYFKQL